MCKRPRTPSSAPAPLPSFPWLPTQSPAPSPSHTRVHGRSILVTLFSHAMSAPVLSLAPPNQPMT